MRKPICATMLALAAAQPAIAADWRLAGESDRGTSYIDLASIAKAGGKARFSRWMVMSTATREGADNLRDSFEVDCASRDYSVVKADFFQQDRAAHGVPVAPRGRAEPGTVLNSLIEIACGARKAIGDSVADPYAAGRQRLGAPPAK